MTTMDGFRLSRIQAEGWNAAHAYPSDHLDTLDATAIEALSPYRRGPRKTRWVLGFRSAFKPAAPRMARGADAAARTDR